MIIMNFKTFGCLDVIKKDSIIIHYYLIILGSLIVVKDVILFNDDILSKRLNMLSKLSNWKNNSEYYIDVSNMGYNIL